ncbi:MAG: preprotein translocase subunit YajC [Lachnospiraceae bacterium]|nr:preprotein translocase subunit YajC [Lachnospiraceae bacterium]
MDIMLANALTGTAGGTTIVTVLYIVAIVAFLYFIMIRPQRKEQNRVKEMLSSLEVGDSVCTTGGFYGIVVDVEEDTVIVEFGNKNCRIPMKKEAIAQIEKPEEPSETDNKKK